MLAAIGLTLIPVWGLLWARTRMKGMDRITSTRLIFAGVVATLPLFAFVLLFVIPSRQWFRSAGDNWFIGVALGADLLSLAAVQRVRSRRLDTSSAERLASSYLATLFVGIGRAELAGLVALVGTFVMGTLWIYLVGMVVAIIGLLLVGPTRREIARRQEQIAAQGSPLSLGAALMASRSLGR
ncbi:MAG: hypothetical protein E6G44_09295 [Actinobacteria bacterium]|nr:MAG: hypothetical protein E6G44_09295 [Actinomycetota bacterium]